MHDGAQFNNQYEKIANRRLDYCSSKAGPNLMCNIDTKCVTLNENV